MGSKKILEPQNALNILLQKRLAAYSVMAGTVLASAVTRGAVIKQSPSAVLDSNGEVYNVQYGGQTKLQIHLRINSFTIPHTTTTHLPGSFMGGAHWTSFYDSYSVGVLPQTGSAGFVNSGSYAKALNFNSTINSIDGFRGTGSSDNMAFYWMQNDFPSWQGGQFLNTSNKYLGIRFQISGATHYGWVQVQVNSNATQATITEWAYESTAGLGIQAGSDVSLPVQSIGLTAVSTAEGVVLAWKTESEVDHLGFVIERRLADSADGVWAKIASYETDQTLKSQGNRSSQALYEFTDRHAGLGQDYIYRVVDIGIDGSRGKEMILQVQHILAIPAELTLHQNYPNPFNPTTTIHFGLPEKQHVILNIYNLTGQKVETLVNEEMGTGEHQVIWNASKYSAGLYFSELITGDQRLVRKMHLIK